MITKEERFLELIKNYSIELSIDSFPFSFNIYNSNCRLIKMQLNHAIISNNKIWSIFEKEYNMNEFDIEMFMYNTLLKYFGIKINGTFSEPYFDEALQLN